MAFRKFKVILEWDAEGKVFNITVPALPGCNTYGKTREEALERSQEAIAGFIEALEVANLPVPESDVEVAEVTVSYG